MGHTLVDESTSSANVLIINPNAEEVVLPCRTSIGQLVLISAVSVARSELRLPTNTAVVLPEYLEDIVKGSHTSLGIPVVSHCANCFIAMNMHFRRRENR